MGAAAYASRLLKARVTFQSKSCPYCGGKRSRLIGRKKVLVELRRCEDCCLQFRFPKDTSKENRDFYQSEYLQWHSEKVQTLSNTSGTAALRQGDYAEQRRTRIELAQQVKPVGHVLDFGASWGLGGALLQDAGFKVMGYEVSEPRAKFARGKFGLNVLSDPNALAALADCSFDMIFCSHVLEHLPDIGATLRSFRRLLKDDGVGVFFVPNGSGEKARTLGVRWGPLCSEEHCLALDAAFFAKALPEVGFQAAFRSDPYSKAPTSDPEAGLLGDELMVIATPI